MRTPSMDYARMRMTRYLESTGAVATVTRKDGDAWDVVSSHPVMVETPNQQQAGIDPSQAGPDDASTLVLTFPYGTDVRSGDRVTASAPEGYVPDIVTISAPQYRSAAVAMTVTGMIEAVAVESHTVTIERWDDDAGAYVPVLTTDAQVVTASPSGPGGGDGAAGVSVIGTAIFTPVPDVAILVGDSIVGIPWAPGAVVTAVSPVVGNRLETHFRYTTGAP